MPNYTEDEYRELLANQSKATKQAPREPRTCGREGCEVVFIPTGPRSKYCPKCTSLVKAEQNKGYKERDKTCAICGKPVGKYKQRVCDDEACTIAYKALAEKDARRAKCGKPSVAECPNLNDPFEGEPNTCPDCKAVYDSTTTCSGDKNKRQFTTKFKGIDMDGFICFCGHRYWRYK